jgi:two-component system KDP operon response regulator KdpE
MWYVGAREEQGIQGQGSKLELAICKGLVEAHGGRIELGSGGASQGATFKFTLPVANEAADAFGSAQTSLRSSRGESESTPILVVYNDLQTLCFVRDALGAAGYSPIITGGHQELSGIIRTAKPRLILLDPLPGTDGIELMESLRELSDLPIIIISAFGRDETIAKALEIGAVDYIVKPFSPTELTARVRAALRRHAQADPFVSGDLSIDYDRRLVYVDGREVELTAIEYELLRVLSVNSGRVLSYDDLLRQVWSGRTHRDPKKLVRVFVRQLRQKLGDDAINPTYIITVRGVGYRMAS